ncbi:MAG: hypothetical protein A2Y62_03990 [Candidatus Fischerbacteria bacterium RBG_13_37_8]|uniref:Uncharacterized protein n=1 Tax=Candidatus Fischerbacteria bacterium RBG_13_37_8 TaxID=1817863 RepID=A0A1F5V5I3_9BACT|nr:MAG: hypothetical protein A2Y62_03990 [Candidatus Fischerbacteria bacterium RBG_13_37_8]
MNELTLIEFIGALAFGLVIGWVTYFILRRAQPKALTDISTLIGILGGATITGLFNQQGKIFAGYAIGLAIGFFSYFIVFLSIVGKSSIGDTLLIKTKCGKQKEIAGGAIMEVSEEEKEEDITLFDWAAQKKKANK